MRKLIYILIFLLLSFQLRAQLSFQADTLHGCVPLAVNFNNQSQSYQSYQWYFGDGGNSTLQNPQYLYSQAGSYSIRLIGINGSSSDTLIKSQYIQVHPKPQIQFSVQNLEHCLGYDSVHFINQSDSTYSYQWSIGDGQVHTQYSFSHQYQSAGNYQIALMAQNAQGCSRTESLSDPVKVRALPDADFAANDSVLCGLGQQANFQAITTAAADYRWNFGNGRVDSLQGAAATSSYSQTGKYDVSLHLTDRFGCSNQKVKTGVIRLSDTANLVSPILNSYCSSEEIQFEADSAVVFANWTFGDGAGSIQIEPKYQYSNAGKYQIEVHTKDSMGCASTFVLDSVEIQQSPIVQLKNQGLIDCAPKAIQIDLDHFYANSFQWQVGNQQYQQAEPIIQLNKSGIYDFELRVSNQQCSDTLLYTDFLELEGGQQDLQTDDTLSCAPATVNIQTMDTTLQSYLWFSGEGDSSAGAIFNHTYHQPGTYRPYLISRSKLGCKDTTYLSSAIEVEDAVENFKRNDTLVLCKPGTVNFNGFAMGGGFWKWKFGDGDSSTQANPTHFFNQPGIYEVSLQTQNTFGCYNYFEPYNVIQVKSAQADFVAVRKNCPNYTVKLFDRTPNAIRWWWSFGDGITDTVQNPVHSYANPGYYEIKLKSWDKDGCIAEKIIPAYEISICQNNDSIPLSSLPGFADSSSSFRDDLDPIQGCLPMQVGFNFPADTALTYFWDFGDGASSTKKNPQHTYQLSGSYTVRLIYRKLDNSYDTIINRNYVEVRSPNSEFDFQVHNYCDSSTVQFWPRDGNSKQYLWNLGSAKTSQIKSPRGTYHQEINEVVSLTVIDSLFCSSTTHKNMVVGNPNPFINYDAFNCLGDTVFLSHNYENYDSVSWLIGGQQFSGDTIYYATNDTGSFPIDLKAYDQNQCASLFPSSIELTVSDPQANFDGFQSEMHCGEYRVQFNNKSIGAENYFWSFGDGDSSKLKSPIHLYDSSGIYLPRLIAAKDGCVSEYRSPQQIEVEIPEVDFRVSQQSDCFPIVANFTALSPNAVRYKWYFGDGDSSSLANPSHSYTTKPTEPVVLEIQDHKGCMASIEKFAIKSFEAGISANQWSGCEPLTVNLTDTNSNSTSWFWDFGDGITSQLKNPTHTYQDSGSYDLKLISRSANACFDTLILHQAIYVGKVKADFALATDSAACAPQLTQFQNLSSGAQTYQWSFDKHGKSTLFEPLQIFSKAGQFDVTLYASDERGCVDSLRKVDLMNINTPEVDFSLSDSNFCGPQSVEFIDHSKRLISRQWYLGDGNVSGNKQLVHEYPNVGSYTVTLVVEDTANCIETLSKKIRHRRKPQARFSIDTFAACSPVQIGFYNHSLETDTAKFWWKLNDELHSSTGIDTNIHFEGSEKYQLGLYVENKNGCRDTALLNQELFTYEEKAPKSIGFLEVSRLLNGAVELKWPSDSSFEFAHYQLYRKSGNGSFVPWLRIEDWKIGTYLLPSVEVQAQDACFKIERVNHCRPVKGADSLHSFCAIDLEATTHEKGIQLNWTPFVKMPNLQYQILKANRKQLNFEPLAYLNNEIHQFVDSTAFCPEDYVYRIRANYSIDEMEYQSMSDSAIAYPGDRILDPSAIQIKMASVVNNRAVLLEWEQPGELNNLINGYSLYRSKLRSGKEIIVQLPAESTSYLDYDVDVNARSYQYQLQVDHQCSTELRQSSQASSILLRSGQEGELQYLKWTEAKGLDGGVKQYIIQKLDEFGNWIEVKRVSADQLQFYLEEK